MKLQSKFVRERFATAIKIDRIPLFLGDYGALTYEDLEKGLKHIDGGPPQNR